MSRLVASDGAGRCGKRLWVWRPRLGRSRAAVLATAIVLGQTACSATSEGGGPAAGASSSLPSRHVHGVARDPGDGKVYLATHEGLFRYGAGQPQRIGPVIDLMGFAVAGPQHFYASGHPGVGVDLPQPVGLIESRDGGQTWQVRSRGGQSDFHALTVANTTLVGFDDQLRLTTDAITWQTRNLVSHPASLALAPDGSQLIATTENGVLTSRDHGTTWRPIAGAPRLLLAGWADAQTLVGITTDGAVATSHDAGQRWQLGSERLNSPQAFSARRLLDGSVEVLVVTHDAVLQSIDGGRSFKPTA